MNQSHFKMRNILIYIPHSSGELQLGNWLSDDVTIDENSLSGHLKLLH